MPVHPRIHAVFGHFQNLNLLALLHDLASGRAAQGAWSSGALRAPSRTAPARLDVLELSAWADNCRPGARLRPRRSPAGCRPGRRAAVRPLLGRGEHRRGLAALPTRRTVGRALQDAEAVQSLLECKESPPPDGVGVVYPSGVEGAACLALVRHGRSRLRVSAVVRDASGTSPVE